MWCHAHQVARQHAYPNSLAGAVLNQSEFVKWRNECGVMLIKWRDKLGVFLIVTNYDGNGNVKQTRRHRQQNELSVPECVRMYNLSMGGVDRLDQFRSYDGIGRSGRRWWKYVFWGVLNIAVINAYIIWVACNRPLLSNARAFSLKTFKAKLVHDQGNQRFACLIKKIAFTWTTLVLVCTGCISVMYLRPIEWINTFYLFMCNYYNN